LRPPVARERIHLTSEVLLLQLGHRWADGTTHLLVDPIELLERLAALTPRPRINLALYYGVLGARATWRALLGGLESTELPTKRPLRSSPTRRRSNLRWAQLLERSFGFPVMAW
jgi:hypothetical protein